MEQIKQTISDFLNNSENDIYWNFGLPILLLIFMFYLAYSLIKSSDQIEAEEEIEDLPSNETKPKQDTDSHNPPPVEKPTTKASPTNNTKAEKEKRKKERKKRAKESQERVIAQHTQRQLEKDEAETKQEKGKSAPTTEKPKITNPKAPTKIVSKKDKKKEILPPATQAKKTPKQQQFYVNYTSQLRETEQAYPLLKIPQKGCIVRSYRTGASLRRGYKEASFQRTISNYFSKHFKVTGNIRLNTGEKTRPYEPDIALIDEKSNLNVRIDIEIDEPYAGIKRNPTHCIGDDTGRDIFFRDRGWIVIRFSEEQVHKKELSCIKYIFKVVQSIYTNISEPHNLELIEELSIQKQWDVLQAQKWEKINYREGYLDHTFNYLPTEEETTERGFTQQEIKEEKEVKPTLLGEVEIEELSGYNKGNISSKDERIEFYPEPHRYTIDKVPAPSVSTVVSKFFPEFDAYYHAANLKPSNPLYGLPVEEIVNTWKSKGTTAAEQGTYLHQQIENYFLDKRYNKPEEFYQFIQFIEKNPVTPFRSEWRIFDEQYHLAGTIDLVVKTDEGYDMYDWKRSKKIVNPENPPTIITKAWGKTGIGGLSHVDDTSYNRYKIQQSLYKYILEKNYNIQINRMFLVVIHPVYDTYYKLPVSEMRKEAEYILESL